MQPVLALFAARSFVLLAPLACVSLPAAADRPVAECIQIPRSRFVNAPLALGPGPAWPEHELSDSTSPPPRRSPQPLAWTTQPLLRSTLSLAPLAQLPLLLVSLRLRWSLRRPSCAKALPPPQLLFEPTAPPTPARDTSRAPPPTQTYALPQLWSERAPSPSVQPLEPFQLRLFSFVKWLHIRPCHLLAPQLACSQRAVRSSPDVGYQLFVLRAEQRACVLRYGTQRLAT